MLGSDISSLECPNKVNGFELESQMKLIMRSKKVLFSGIIILIIGIIVRKTTAYEASGLALILLGVLLKTLYIIAKARSGEYKPGKELLFLFLGLGLFFSGIYLRTLQQGMMGPILMIIGIVLKIIYIVLFVRNIKSNQVW